LSRKPTASGRKIQISGSSSSGMPATKNTDCQPWLGIRYMPRKAEVMPPTE